MPTSEQEPVRVHVLSRPQRGLLVVVLAVLLAGTLALVFGPASPIWLPGVMCHLPTPPVT